MHIEHTRAEVLRAAGMGIESWAEWLSSAESHYLLHREEAAGVEAVRRLGFIAGVLHQEGEARGFPKVGRTPIDRAYYYAMRLDGEAHTTAEMLCLMKPPMSNTDREFLEGHCNGNQFEKTPYLGDWYAQKARAAGVDITGRVYISGLAKEPGDPEAWVSGRGDLERVVRERGWSCQGASNIKGECRQEAAPDTDVADDIVESRMRDRVEKDPGLALGRPDDLYHETRESLKPSWAA